MKKNLLSWLRKALILVLSWTPVQYALTYILPRIRFSTGYARADGRIYDRVWLQIRPGDIIFSLDRAKLTSLLIPGHWEHVALVGFDKSIIEAVPIHGVRKTNLFEFMRTADEVMIMRPWETSQVMVDQVLMEAGSYLGHRYDSVFTKGPEALYCAELVATCYQPFVNFDWSDVWGLGMPYVSPDGIADCAGFKLIYRSGQV